MRRWFIDASGVLANVTLRLGGVSEGWCLQENLLLKPAPSRRVPPALSLCTSPLVLTSCQWRGHLGKAAEWSEDHRMV